MVAWVEVYSGQRSLAFKPTTAMVVLYQHRVGLWCLRATFCKYHGQVCTRENELREQIPVNTSWWSVNFLRLAVRSIWLSHVQSVLVLQSHRNLWFPPLQFQNRAKTSEALGIACCFLTVQVCFLGVLRKWRHNQRTIALYYKTATPNRGLTGT